MTTTAKITKTMFFLLASLLAPAVYHVSAEGTSDGGSNNDDSKDDHVVESNEQSNDYDYDYEMGGGEALEPTWMTTLYDKINEIASVWSSRVIVAIAVIVVYDLFSPERRQRRRQELEERQRLRQEQREQEQQQKKTKDQQEDLSPLINQPKKEDNEKEPKVFQGTSQNNDEGPNGQLSSSRASSTLQQEDVGQKKHNEFLDRLEQEQQRLVHDKTEGNKDVDTTSEKQKSSSTKTNKKTKHPPPSLQTQQQRSSHHLPPRMKATNNGHPGMTEFSYWYDVETSLFRIYTLTRKDKQEVLLPYAPNSRRGNVSIFLNVKNSTGHTIKVFWVDYTGKHVLKGTIKPNYTWEQTTYIDHPWVFEDAYDEQPYLYYVPYRAIPTLPTAQTLSPDGETAMHKFTLVPSKPNDDFLIGVQDDIMPHPGIVHFHQPLLGITWALTHMSRMMSTDDPRVDTLQKYLKNIMDDPEPVKYRQVRIASKNFAPIWQSPMRGLLHAIGFVEVGAYAELGCADIPLSRGRVQEVALLSYLLTQWRFKPTSDSQLQPAGALDGYGRAGFGRAGSANN